MYCPFNHCHQLYNPLLIIDTLCFQAEKFEVKESDLKDYFNSLANKDGKLDIPTFKHVLKQLGLHPDEGIVTQTIEEIQSKSNFIPY